ncbi:MAG: trehalose-phosphatase [Candidatus Omnitrophica bacterium]|nr:trehalose-phosphatase [Candidatus Omnitrophota bacterium]
MRGKASSPASVWSHWPAIRERIGESEFLLLFLDYDGTLAPLADHPSKTRLPSGAKDLLRRLACRAGIRVALVSGRRLKDLKASVRLERLCYVGNHGLELEGNGLRYENPLARKSRPLLKKIARDLKGTLGPLRGVWVEDKDLSLSVHYRNASPGDELLVKNGFYEVVHSHLLKRQVRVTAGKQVFEVRPPVRWTKGTMVNWLLARWSASIGKTGILPIYVGDDETDEDAFEALWTQGITVAVEPATPLTKARYLVDSPEGVQRFLGRLLRVWTAKEKSDGPSPGV